MASIRKELVIDTQPNTSGAPSATWAPSTHGLRSSSSLTPGSRGDSRIVTFANGEVVLERIVDIDDRTRRLAYAVVEWRTTHHNASFQVVPDGDRRCRVVWITGLLPDTLADLVEGFMDQGAAAIKRTLETADAAQSIPRR